jgi:nucleotide-binding universal stress UspA family protein
MSEEGPTATKSSEEDGEELDTIDSENSKDNSTKPSTEMKVVVVAPTKTEHKESQPHQSTSREENKEIKQTTPAKSKIAEQSFKDLVRPAGHKATSLASTSQPSTTDSPANLEYRRILVPHDGSEMSDKALNHAIYLSKLSSAEILILNVLEHIGNKESSSLMATSRGDGIEKAKKEDLEIAVSGRVKQMIQEKLKLCRDAGVKSEVSYKIQTGKPVDEIVKISEEINVDLIVMASSRISSSIKVLGSTTRRVIDHAKRPVLVIHK